MGPREAAFIELSGAVRHLFHQLRAVAEAATPSTDGFTASHRGVMESLATGGPQTVPAMARARPVSRQHIQVLVNDLLERGWVETSTNPEHRRSPLIALTAAGARRFQEIRRTESQVLSSLRCSLPPGRMAELAADLGRVSADLSRWLAAHTGED